MVVGLGIGRFVYTPILPMMVAEEGLTISQAGLIASSNFLGYLMGAMIASTSLLRGSPRAWLFGALVTSSLSTILMAWMQGYVMFLIMRFVGGLVSAWVLVYATSLVISRLVEIGREELISVLFSGVGVGVVVAALLTGLAINRQTGWQGAWIYSGIAALVATILVVLLVPGKRKDAVPKPAASRTQNCSIAGLLAAYGLFGFGYVITATFLIQLVRSAYFSVEVEMTIWALVGLAAVPSVWLWNSYAMAVGNCRAFSVSCRVLAAGVAASVLLPGLWGLVSGAICLGSTFMAITALGLVEARSRFHQDPRYVMAMMTAMFGLGQIIGPALGGYLSDVLNGFLWPSLLASTLLVLAGWLVYR